MPKRSSFTVALVGADGAGKSTVGRRVAATLPLPVRYIYMGDNPESANWTLPTSRLLHALRRARGVPAPHHGPPDPAAAPAPARARGALRRLLRSAKEAARLAHRLAEEWYRQAVAWQFVRRGYVVLFDRHYFADYHAHHIARDGARAPGARAPGARPLAARLHGLVLEHLYPRPDLVVFLDAPAAVLLARKGEGTLESLERRRREYVAIRPHVAHFAVVDASRPVDAVAREVTRLIEDLHQQRLDAGAGETACATP